MRTVGLARAKAIASLARRGVEATPDDVAMTAMAYPEVQKLMADPVVTKIAWPALIKEVIEEYEEERAAKR
jgi:hypothetical protein